MKTTFADVEPNPAIVCVVGPAAVVTFPFNSRQAAVGGAVLAPGGGFLARAPCPSYNPNPNTSIEFPLGVSLAWYVVQWCKLNFGMIILAQNCRGKFLFSRNQWSMLFQVGLNSGHVDTKLADKGLSPV